MHSERLLHGHGTIEQYDLVVAARDGIEKGTCCNMFDFLTRCL